MITMSRHSVMYIGPYYIYTYHSALKTTCSTGFLKRLQYFDFANNSASIASIDVHANAIYWKDVLYVNFHMHLFIFSFLYRNVESLSNVTSKILYSFFRVSAAKSSTVYINCLCIHILRSTESIYFSTCSPIFQIAYSVFNIMFLKTS